MSDRTQIYKAIDEERTRQEFLHGSMSIGGLHLDDDQRMTVLVEEVGEVAAAVNSYGGDEQLARELVQVAACAVGWLERLGVRSK